MPGIIATARMYALGCEGAGAAVWPSRPLNNSRFWQLCRSLRAAPRATLRRAGNRPVQEGPRMGAGKHRIEGSIGAVARERGVTLVELLAVVAIVAILATMAAPTFGSLRRTAGVGAAATELLAALHFARSAAALDSQPVTLCLSVDGETCVSSSADPAHGWLGFGRPRA